MWLSVLETQQNRIVLGNYFYSTVALILSISISVIASRVV